jgi:hypothetical protein
MSPIVEGVFWMGYSKGRWVGRSVFGVRIEVQNGALVLGRLCKAVGLGCGVPQVHVHML